VTTPNDSGCGDLSFEEFVPKLAICGLLSGSVQVISLNSDVRPTFFQTHMHPLSIIKFSPNSSLIATASSQGTLIRVFDSASGSLMNVLRRGSLQSQILAIAISPGNQKLAAVSLNGTVHAFLLSNRVTDDDKAPRAVSKLKIAISKAVDMAFLSENELMMVTGSGVCSFVDAKDGKLAVRENVLALAR